MLQEDQNTTLLRVLGALILPLLGCGRSVLSLSQVRPTIKYVACFKVR
jgi:hypothetical protein